MGNWEDDGGAALKQTAVIYAHVAVGGAEYATNWECLALASEHWARAARMFELAGDDYQAAWAQGKADECWRMAASREQATI